MPKLTKCTKINEEDIIMLNEEAFGCKRNGMIRAGIDMHSRNGSTTRAKSRAVSSIVKSSNNPKLTAEQTLLELRASFTHHNLRVIFKSAGLLDATELDALSRIAN